MYGSICGENRYLYMYMHVYQYKATAGDFVTVFIDKCLGFTNTYTACTGSHTCILIVLGFIQK